MDWSELIKWGGGLIAAAVGAGLVFRFVVVRKSSRNSSRAVNQSNNKAGRDIIGGDSVKNDRR